MKKEIKDELRSISSVLADLPDSMDSKSADEKYFSEMQDEVIARVKKPTIRRLLLPAAIAAAAMITIGFFIFSGSDVIIPNQSLSWEEISEDEMEVYLLANVGDHEYDLFADAAKDLDLSIDLYDDETLTDYIIENVDEDILEEEFLTHY
ncbi:MAG: hypothetical protein HKN92_02515 [Chitinophagales bacterium]|nr:hypothetical protein [Chitinophagales bacterium]